MGIGLAIGNRKRTNGFLLHFHVTNPFAFLGWVGHIQMREIDLALLVDDFGVSVNP